MKRKKISLIIRCYIQVYVCVCIYIYIYNIYIPTEDLTKGLSGLPYFSERRKMFFSQIKTYNTRKFLKLLYILNVYICVCMYIYIYIYIYEYI